MQKYTAEIEFTAQEKLSMTTETNRYDACTGFSTSDYTNMLAGMQDDLSKEAIDGGKPMFLRRTRVEQEEWHVSKDSSSTTASSHGSTSMSSSASSQSSQIDFSDISDLICEEVPKPVTPALPVRDFSGLQSKKTRRAGKDTTKPEQTKEKPISRNKNVKREICQFWLKGCCERGVTCTYAHGEHQFGDEIIATPIATCKWWLQGNCRLGSKCKYAHVNTAAEGELFAFDMENSKLEAKEFLKPKYEKEGEGYNTSRTHKPKSASKVGQKEGENKPKKADALTFSERSHGRDPTKAFDNSASKIQRSPRSNADSALSWRSNVNKPTTAVKPAALPAKASQESVVPPPGLGFDAAPKVEKPQSEEERKRLMALLNDVVEALK